MYYTTDFADTLGYKIYKEETTIVYLDPFWATKFISKKRLYIVLHYKTYKQRLFLGEM